MIITRLKIALAVGIFSIILSFVSVYKFVSNDKIIALYESFMEKFAEFSIFEKIESNKKDGNSADDEKDEEDGDADKKKKKTKDKTPTTPTTSTNKP